MKTIRMAGLLTVLCLLLYAAAASAAHAPHYGSLVDCTSCHTAHNAAGPSLTSVAENANLCMSCHFVGGIARNKPFSTSMQSSGAFKTSHGWSGSMPNSVNNQNGNNPYGLRTDDEVVNDALRNQLASYGECSNGSDSTKESCSSLGTCSSSLYTTEATCIVNGTCSITSYTNETACTTNGGTWTQNAWTPHTPGTWTAKVVCSTCHSVMYQSNTPWDPWSKPVVIGTTTGGSTNTLTDITQTWTPGQWAGYFVRTPNTDSGSIQVIGSNSDNTITLISGEEFSPAVTSGKTYGIMPKGKHFMRMGNDLNQMCEDCHYYRTAGAYTDLKTYDGTKKSHPVVKNISTDVANASLFVGVAPYEPNCKGASCAQAGAPRYHENGGTNANITDNIVFDDNGKIRCMSCHGIHYTDSNSSTVDQP
ncbi:MAG: cytochrome c3 family protein [Nitrospirae bacterium]|nr:cytochrome c3 family protein [Nitrospirota bacterium]